MKQHSWVAVAGLLIVAAFALPAFAQTAPATVSEEEFDKVDAALRSEAMKSPVIAADGAAIETPASHVYLVDAATGTVLLSKSADLKMYPSSMTKLMTLYLVFEKLKEGTLALDNQFTVSEKAWRMQGSKMFVPLGGQIPLQDLIRGIAIQSGNDACVVAAEGLAGSEEAFAKLMNDKAKQLGMVNSHFVDASGWPHPEHYTTAHDLAILSAALIRDFPQYYPYLSEREFTYHGIRQFNRNLLLNNPSMKVDGLKTGHTEAAGYGIALSAKDPLGDRRLILVVNGLNSEAERASEGERLLQWGLRNFTNKTLAKANMPLLETKVWLGNARRVGLSAAEDLLVSVPIANAANAKVTAEYLTWLNAPIKKGDKAGVLKVTVGDSVHEVPLVVTEDVEKISLFAKVPRVIGSWFGAE